MSRITLAGIHVLRADLDAAVGVGHDLLSTSPTLGSIRVAHQLDDLRRLLEPHTGYRPVREYLTRFDDARRARMLLLADIIVPPRSHLAALPQSCHARVAHADESPVPRRCSPLFAASRRFHDSTRH